MTFTTSPFASLLATVAAGVIATPLLAVSPDTFDGIITDLTGQGFTRLSIRDYGIRVKVEASGPNGQIERIYDDAGVLLLEKTADLNAEPKAAVR